MRALTGLFLLLLAGCAAKSDVDYDPGFDFTTVSQVQLLPSRHRDEPLAAERSERALTEALAASGWQLVDQSSHKLQISLWRETEANDSGFSIGIGGGRRVSWVRTRTRRIVSREGATSSLSPLTPSWRGVMT